jgi:hypothetical protein
MSDTYVRGTSTLVNEKENFGIRGEINMAFLQGDYYKTLGISGDINKSYIKTSITPSLKQF